MSYRFLFILFTISSYFSAYSQPKEAANLAIHPKLIPLLNEKLAPFYHGVASGDPTQTSVIIWTCITLNKNVESASLNWEVATDSFMNNIIQSGEVITNKVLGFTVKVDVENLKEDSRYYYRFKYKDHFSIIGHTHTLPLKPERFSIAFVSCSNYEWGFFTNYRFIAEDTTINLVVHLGDYIYEYAPAVYGDTSLGRVNVPAKEIITLDDYRTRYSLYRLDKDLMKVHRYKPFITTWDDHEIANNGYLDGAQNHQANEGNWHVRKAAAKQAYYEWLPVRDNTYHELYRSFQFGSLFNLIVLDTRLAGRTAQVPNEANVHYTDSSRTILGKDQYNWLTKQLRDKNTTWKIIANQVPFGPMFRPTLEGKKEKYMDGWDGYPYERAKLIKTIGDEKLKDIVFVTGDFHSSFAFENALEATASSNDNVSVEFVVTSISSANDDEWFSADTVKLARQLYYEFNPHCRYVNNKDHGYLVLTIEKETITSDFYYASSIKTKQASKRLEESFIVNKGLPILIQKR